MTIDTDLATLLEAAREAEGADFDAGRPDAKKRYEERVAALDRVETEFARLQQEVKDMTWRRDWQYDKAIGWHKRAEAAERELARLQEGLRRGIDIAEQYFDTGRGDLDGWIENARALLAEDGAA